MTAKRDMFNILNAQGDDSASLTTVLHHTVADSSVLPVQNRLRFRHIQHLAAMVRRVNGALGSKTFAGPQASNPVNSH